MQSILETLFHLELYGVLSLVAPDAFRALVPDHSTVSLQLPCVFSSLRHRGAAVGVAILGGCLLTGGVVGLGVYLDQFARDPAAQGVVTLVLTGLLFITVTLVGDWAYAQKEAAAGDRVTPKGTVPILAVAVGLVLFLLIVITFVR